MRQSQAKCNVYRLNACAVESVTKCIEAGSHLSFGYTPSLIKTTEEEAATGLPSGCRAD